MSVHSVIYLSNSDRFSGKRSCYGFAWQVLVAKGLKR